MPLSRSSPPSERMPKILAALEKAYPDAKVALRFSNPLECVVATVLSAQSTDVKVNEVTERLFVKYPRPEDYLAVPEEELQEDIHATGFFRQKTKALRGLATKLLEDFGGEVPSTIAELITLPGVARKTANIVQGNCFPEAASKDPDAGMAVDTHVGRVSVRLGLTEWDSKEAVRIEQDLLPIVPAKKRLRTVNLFIEHGRQTCIAKKPECARCPIEPLCPSSQEAGLPDLFRVKAKPRAKPRGA
ncbi:MAG TPA: endonuclease III [Actinomycetota bacterium]|nr:endonuclease III [Actinomycetota bacterium]